MKQQRQKTEKIIRPTPYRRHHDLVLRATAQMQDAQGEIGVPFIAEGLLARLERAGSIGAKERAAGEEFHRLFQLAHLDPMRAADLARISGAAGPGVVIGSEVARRKIIKAMDALGGHNSPCGACCWYVLGCEFSMRDAAKKGWDGRAVREEVAKGYLIGGLGVLVRHFGY